MCSHMHPTNKIWSNYSSISKSEIYYDTEGKGVPKMISCIAIRTRLDNLWVCSPSASAYGDQLFLHQKHKSSYQWDYLPTNDFIKCGLLNKVIWVWLRKCDCLGFGRHLHYSTLCPYSQSFAALSVCIYIMAGHAIVVVKGITLLFYLENAVLLTLW